jgi:peptide-methionine (S)-S-oxide reductase
MNFSGENLQRATFGAGCFWCVEAAFQRLEGVISVTSGYMGGEVRDPSYEQVCSGQTGHAEVVQIEFNPARISYRDLLEVFWKVHNPTTLNRQGADVGTQYRSVIFHHSSDQKQEAEEAITKLNQSGRFDAPILTELAPADVFYPAEAYHHNYYNRNPGAPYCQMVIRPKLEKL